MMFRFERGYGKMTEERPFELGWYEERDKTAILEINRAEYGDVALSHEAYFDWLQTQCPPGIPYRVIREKATGQVIAFSMSVAIRVSWCGKELPALIGANLVVAPAYRRQGVYRTLSDSGKEKLKERGYRFQCVFPNPKSMPLLARSDKHHLVCQVPLVIHPLNVGELTEMHVSNPLLRWGVNLGWEVAGRTLWRERRPPPNGLPMTIVEETEFDESYDRFWEQVKSKYELLLVRDRAFLQWRFHDIPVRRYQALSARQDAEILGYIVLRQADVRGTMSGLIADFLVVPGERGNQAGLCLLHEAMQRFRRARLSLSGGLMLPRTQEYAIMRRAGYVSAPKPFAPQSFYLFVRSYSSEPPLSVLTRPESWYVSIADHDAV